MKLMKRNLKPIWYCLYLGNTIVYDDDGYETGEKEITYGNPVEKECSVSPATGVALREVFGVADSYDYIMLTDDMNCPINENTLVYSDNPNGSNAFETYVVRRVAKSLNHLTYGLSRVELS